jgi:hypothetical protein
VLTSAYNLVLLENRPPSSISYPFDLICFEHKRIDENNLLEELDAVSVEYSPEFANNFAPSDGVDFGMI